MLRSAILCLTLAVSSGMVLAQGASVALGTGTVDTSLPVEVSADELRVDQSSGQAVLDGNVLIVQGQVRISASKVTIEYATDDGSPSGVSRLLATGGVTFVTTTDAAEAETAIYSVENGTVTLDGNVLLTQGQSAISGDRLVMNLGAGSGRMEGRVRTVITPAGNDN
jgi:lipopolysaccharide export system protein LptA